MSRSGVFADSVEHARVDPEDRSAEMVPATDASPSHGTSTSAAAAGICSLGRSQHARPKQQPDHKPGPATGCGEIENQNGQEYAVVVGSVEGSSVAREDVSATSHPTWPATGGARRCFSRDRSRRLIACAMAH